MMLMMLCVLLACGVGGALPLDCSDCHCSSEKLQFLAESVQVPHLHVHSSLTTISLSPWTYNHSFDLDRVPQLIRYAVCEPRPQRCSRPRAVTVEISVYRRRACPHYSPHSYSLLREPYTLTVGCTCIKI